MQQIEQIRGLLESIAQENPGAAYILAEQILAYTQGITEQYTENKNKKAEIIQFKAARAGIIEHLE